MPIKKTIKVILILSTFLFSYIFSVAAYAALEIPPKNDSILLTANMAAKAPKINGILEKNEKNLYTKLQIDSSMLSYITENESGFARAKNLSFEIYSAYDDTYLYFALTYHLNKNDYISNVEDKFMWGQSCVMISLASENNTGKSGLEIGYTKNSDNAQNSYYVFNRPSGSDYAPNENDYAIIYSDSILTYEIRIPFSAFNASPNDKTIKACFLISSGNHTDSTGYIHTQIGQGISGFSTANNADAGKDVSLFPTLKLTGIQNPETGSFSVIIFAALMILSASSALTIMLYRKQCRFTR